MGLSLCHKYRHLQGMFYKMQQWNSPSNFPAILATLDLCMLPLLGGNRLNQPHIYRFPGKPSWGDSHATMAALEMPLGIHRKPN